MKNPAMPGFCYDNDANPLVDRYENIMRKILLTINRLEHFGQHERTFFDLVEYFHRHSWQVDIAARVIGHYWLGRINNINENQSLRLLHQQDHTLSDSYTLLWIFNGYISLELNAMFRKGQYTSKVIFQHFYSYADYDLPYGCDVENKLASFSLACSTVSYIRLAEKGIPSPRLKIFPFAISQEFASAKVPSGAKLKKALIIFSGINENLVTQIETFSHKGITLDYYNLDSVAGPVTPELLANYQLIIGDEINVALAMGMGLPVVISNGISSHGYLSHENLLERSDYHFSLTGAKKIINQVSWLNEIIRGYKDAAKWALNYREEAISHFLLDSIATSIIERLPAPKHLLITDEHAYRLESHRKVMESLDEEKTRSVNSWMNDRKPTDVRSSIIATFLHSLPTFASIIAVINDREGCQEKLCATIKSIKKQSLMADAIVVAGNHAAHFSQEFSSICYVDHIAAIIEEAPTATILFIEAGDVLESYALITYAEFSMREPEKEFWYFDEVFLSENKDDSLILKPELDIDLLRAFPYIGSSVFISVSALRRHRGFASEFINLGHVDLCWKLIEEKGPGSIGHIPEVLIGKTKTINEWIFPDAVSHEIKKTTERHLARCNIEASVQPIDGSGVHKILYAVAEEAKVSVIIPTKDRFVVLQQCIDSLMDKTLHHQYEIIIVDNGSTEPDARTYLDNLEMMQLSQVKVLHWDSSFNFAAINNYAALQASGEYLLFMNNDIEIIDGNWMSALLEHAQRPEVGIAGSKLLYPDGTLEHGGFITGINDGVIVGDRGRSSEEEGFLNRLKVPRGAQAVSAACMMMRKDVFSELGGFDEVNFPLYFADVDLALKARAKGYLNIWTPFSQVRHLGGASRLFPEKFNVATHADDACHDMLLQQWGSTLAQDPYYNPRMNRLGSPFNLNTRMSRLPQILPGKPLPVVMGSHINWTGCGNYRVIKPLQALQQELKVDGGLILGIPSVMEVAHFQPDILILEVPIADNIPQTIARYRKVSEAKIIMEFDDYYLNIPEKNIHSQNLPKDIHNRLSAGLALADWVVVSTQPLAEAYAHFHSDIRVAKNRLDSALWGHLKSSKRHGKKARVGWAGGSSHTGDLEILLPLFQELQNEVEWVFMGMKPEGVDCEFHLPVPFEHYPQKLSELDLDLALVPLEINLFNECKSNLRLLELGSCGIPIICTDIEPYRCGLPVKCVANTPKAWLSAIREHISDRQELERRGEALRNAVHHDWMLSDKGLEDWERAWLG